MNQALLIIELLEAAVSAATRAGVNIAQFNAMREANGGEALTEEQRAALLEQSQSGIDRLPDSPDNPA